MNFTQARSISGNNERIGYFLLVLLESERYFPANEAIGPRHVFRLAGYGVANPR